MSAAKPVAVVKSEASGRSATIWIAKPSFDFGGWHREAAIAAALACANESIECRQESASLIIIEPRQEGDFVSRPLAAREAVRRVTQAALAAARASLLANGYAIKRSA